MKKSELRSMIREMLREELGRRPSEKIAFIDQTGSAKYDVQFYYDQINADGFDGTVEIIYDTFMSKLQDCVNAGYDVTLYTCDDDYEYNCPDIVNKDNFKVVLL